VCFIDRQIGWVVGDRGTIWHTDDGGRHWDLQPSGVACRLESVCFINAQVGWAAGGFSYPYTHTGAGVLLSTEDGGRHWTRHTKLLLPPLKRVKFFGPRSGVAIADPSAMFPSGIFTTETSGRSWDPMPGERMLGSQVGDFLDARTGAIEGRGGPAAVVQGRLVALEEAADALRGLRQPTRLELTPPNGGWGVGQGGLVLRTADQGASWHRPPGDLASLGVDQFDFAALEVRGANCWIAGNPGTRVFFTPDAGRTWSAFPTGQSIPLAAICFVDDEHGFAVGALGTILASTDGGRTWTRQRCGGSRAALLGIFSEPKDVPWELFVRLSGNEGYLGVVEVVHRRDAEVPSRVEVSLDDRLREAANRTGACDARIAWQFPLRQPGLDVPAAQVLQAWDRVHGGRGMEALEAHLVRSIRIWRPEVMVVQDPAAGDEAVRVLGQSVLKAAAMAAEPGACREQIDQMGLEPWQVKRVFTAQGPAAQGAVQVTAAQLADHLGCSLGDVAATARALVEDRFRVAPASLGFQVAIAQSAEDRGTRDFFAGLLVAPGSEARRPALARSADSPELVRRLAQRRRSTLAIVERSGQDPRTRAALLAEARDLTEGLDRATAAELLYQLAQTYHRSGHWPMAAEVLEMLCQCYADEPLSRPAQVWLVQYYSSGEARWRIEGPQRSAVVQTSALATDPREAAPRSERALALGSQLQQTRPDLFAQPEVGFPLAALQRRQQPRLAERFYSVQRSSAIDRAWRDCARAEQWLADPRGSPPKPVLHCRRASSPPHLDGNLDDSLWKQAQKVDLRSPLGDDAPWPAAVRMAYDAEFLYVAIEAQKGPGAQYEAPPPGPRPRDANLAARDRVELLIDLDRDFATYYRLAVDDRGWTQDECWGDATWNPTWFVAAASSRDAWTAELAIPLEQLTGGLSENGPAWAIGLQRIVPGVGFQSWNTPAAIEVIPEGFGYLVFE
jgi:photosystem II stability/assembly factor-like uncharacterized protein